MIDVLPEGEALGYLGPSELCALMHTCEGWRKRAGCNALWRAVAKRSPFVRALDLDDGVDWRQICAHAHDGPRPPVAGRTAAVPDPADASYVLVVAAQPMRRPNSNRAVVLGGARGLPAAEIRDAFAAVVPAAAIAEIAPTRAVFRSDAAAEAATRFDGISLRGRRLRVRLEADDAWRTVAFLPLAFLSPLALRTVDRVDDALLRADEAGARVVRFTVVAYSRAGLFQPTVAFKQDLPRAALEEDPAAQKLFWSNARYNAIGTAPSLYRGFFCWAADDVRWGHLRVSRSRRAAAASCGFCARDAPRKLRCCEATYFCDAECARQAWLFSHRKRCPREAPVE